MASTLIIIETKNTKLKLRTHPYVADIALPLKLNIKVAVDQAFHSTWGVMVGAATVTISRPSPLALLQDDTMHTLHVRAKVVDPVEPSGTIFTLVLQKIGVVNDAVPAHRVSRWKVFVADVTGKSHVFSIPWWQRLPQQRLCKVLHCAGPVIGTGGHRCDCNIWNKRKQEYFGDTQLEDG